MPVDALIAEVCAGRAPCAVLEALPVAGDLEVVTLVLADFPAGLDPAEPADPCFPREIWRVGGGLPPLLLAQRCNDGNGAHGIGGDAVRVSGARVGLSQYGGSNWSWSNSAEVELSPLRTVGLSEDDSHLLLPNAETLAIDVATWTIDELLTLPSCTDAGTADEEGPLVEGGARAIPQLAVVGEWDWATTALGACAAGFDGGDPTDAAFRVFAPDADTLVVELADDAFVRGKRGRDRADHLELFLAPGLDAMSDCAPAGDAPLAAWRIPIGEGEPTVLSGDPGSPPGVTQAVSGVAPVRRLRIALPPGAPHGRLALAYVDVDGRRDPALAFGTAALPPTHPASLSRLWSPPLRFSCVPEGGALTVVEAFPAEGL